MGLFEWLVLILLVSIFFRIRERNSKIEDEKLDALLRIEALLRQTNSQLGEIEATTGSISQDVTAIHISKLPEYPPDGP